MFDTHLHTAPALVRALIQPIAVDAYTLSTGRFLGALAAAVALAGVIVGGSSLARSAGRNRTGKRRALLALGAGVTSTVTGGLVVAAADGGPGTGNGIVGGFAALGLGLTATALGWLC